ncbi:nectin-2 isoform X2 [Erpetoichthys calabaricus]|uniref:nectin-2 isoform X2 n=1 Tax=Erpetoichthys calabaricus TaxID=27687 RepID=UPI0010A07DFE|nr:nectin-2 isoform X2 [Erpetoichthys calabaricus]
MVMARRASPSLPAAALLLLLMQAVSGQRVKVIPEVTAYPGDEVSLRCSFVDPNGEVKKSQVTWIRDLYHEKKQNIAVYNPMFGESYPESSIKGRVSFRTSSLDDPTIVINPVKLEDEGSYICEYATYPSGNEEGVTKLYVLAKPVNYGEAIQVQEGPKLVPVARCVSSSGKPPAEISWVSSFPGNITTENQTNPNGTVTVNSTFSLVPSGLIHDYVITCQVHHKTLATPEKFNIKLNVNHSPLVSISGYDDNWYLGREGASLVCQSRANPPATSVTWKAANGKIPDSVQVNGEILQVKKVDPSVNTTFICEVTNSMGVSQRELSVFVRDIPKPMAAASTGSIIGGIIAAILIIGVLVTIYMIVKRHRKNGTEDDFEGPPTHKPPPPQKTEGSLNSLDKIQKFPKENSTLLQTEYFQKEPVTELDNFDPPTDSAPVEYIELGQSYNPELQDYPPYTADEYDEDYLEHMNPIYNQLSYSEPRSVPRSGAFVMSPAMYV